MRKLKSLLLIIFALVSFNSFATHIAGGDLDIQRVSGNDYRITLKLFRDCANGGAGFDNNVRTCNNNSVNAKFKIHYASDDCNSENVFLNYSSPHHTKISVVDTPRSSQLNTQLVNGYNTNPGTLNASVFENDAGVCNNKSNIKDQRINLSYSINHKKENIKLSKLMVENRNGKPIGNGMLFYNSNGNSFEYIM